MTVLKNVSQFGIHVNLLSPRLQDGPRFFLRYKSSVVCHNMRKDVRESVGLRSTSEMFTGCVLTTINSAFLMNSLVYFILDLPSQKEARHFLARA